MSKSSLKPSPESVKEMWGAAKRWSPAGIAGGMLIVFFAIGGHDGVEKLVHAFGVAEELRSEIRGLRDDMKIEREERAKVMARLHANEENLSSLCDFVSDMNGGRPNSRWCSQDSRSIRIDTKLHPPPMKTTAQAWLYVD